MARLEAAPMKERFTVVTRKGQITIPAEFRRALGIREGDRVALVMDNDHVTLVHCGSVVERTRGVLRSSKPALSARELREAVEAAFAGETIARSGGQ
jgi:AbrB family looped-hinge helix DNA binding protein